MIMDGRALRLKRLLGQGRSVIVAVDHGLFDGPIPGMEVLPETVRRINPVVDAVLVSPGMLRHCSSVFAGYRRPLALVRLNWNTVYCFSWNYKRAKSVDGASVEAALREGMDIALVSLTLQTGDEERDAQNVALFSRLTEECHQLGIPVMGEYFPTGHLDMNADELHENVYMGSRIIAELGADCIKTFNTKRFSEVVNTCAVPVFGLGAEKLPTQLDALRLAERIIGAGAAGVVFGRNAIQVPDPIAFQSALCRVVRDGLSPAAVADGLGPELEKAAV
ncbi:MAG: hypothetical protein IT366_17540 [Candidatus Hydrogenedentes bacterium]|nr:hypothetical protein [Candidatus Hydrogenedentota bacterium]